MPITPVGELFTHFPNDLLHTIKKDNYCLKLQIELNKMMLWESLFIDGLVNLRFLFRRGSGRFVPVLEVECIG